jgi:Fungal chitosanase of glycosyl hydrolase group 75
MHAPSESPSWQPPRKSRRGLWIALVLLAAGGAALLLPPVKQKVITVIDRLRSEKVVMKREVVERIVEKRVEVPVPPAPLPSGPVTGTRKDVTTIFGGIKVQSTLEAEAGGRATKERTQDSSYVAEFTFKLKVPQAAKTLEDFTGINPKLPEFLPSLKDLLDTAKVSGLFHYQYEHKQKFIQANILRLDRVLSRHNFYDLESILELEHAGAKQKVLLLQGEMDVVSDGSDGDRMTSFDDYIFKSQHFQPTTSYAWPKQTQQQNPLIPRLEAEAKEIAEKLKAAGLSNAEKAALKDRAGDIPRIIGDLKRRSFLIAQEDPFVVIPLSFRTYRGSYAYTPDIGDYAIVICDGKLMPAIVGDYGPAEKSGEASLRIAREIDSKSGPYNRPVSDLKVTYLIFPNSADKERTAPDYAAWHKRCGELFTKIGGDPAKLHQWEDRLKKPAPPAVPAATTNPAPVAPQ